MSAIIFNFEHSIISENYKNIILSFKELSFLNILYLTIIQTVILSLGIPSTPLIILNFVFFSIYGFLISMTSIILSSIITFQYSTYISKLFKMENKIYKYTENLKHKNFFIKVFTSRFIIPLYFHNLIFGLIKSNPMTFMLAVILADFISIFAIYFVKEIF